MKTQCVNIRLGLAVALGFAVGVETSLENVGHGDVEVDLRSIRGVELSPIAAMQIPAMHSTWKEED